MMLLGIIVTRVKPDMNMLLENLCIDFKNYHEKGNFIIIFINLLKGFTVHIIFPIKKQKMFFVNFGLVIGN